MKSDGPQAPWRKLYPFSSHYHDADGHRQHYIDEGPRDAPPLVMVHGNPTWSFYWRNLVAGLSERYRTIAVDHLGCGLSDKPQDYDYCLNRHVDNLSGLIESLDLQNATLIAHDWGGAIGTGALLKHRSRFNRIVLCNTAAFPPPYIPFRIRVCRWPVIGKIGVQGFNLFARAAQTMTTERPNGLPDDVAAGMIAPYDSWANRIAVYQFVRDIPLSPAHRTWDTLAEMERRLPELADMPIQLIWGMKDWCFRPECLDRFESVWPNAEVHRHESAGHYVVEDEPEQVVDQVREFLNRTDR